MMRDFVPIVTAKCESCGGLVAAKRNLMGTDYTRDAKGDVVWLHMRVEDWQNDPHFALPTKDGRDKVATALAERAWKKP
jgi:hypothetical protein